MPEAISAHKKMAMGITEGNKLKTGGVIRKFAVGGLADGGPKKPDFKAGTAKIATMKKGGAARGR